MCEKFIRNRESLVDLIYGMESFTEESLRNKFIEERGSIIAIDSRQTIGEFLNELTEDGVLNYKFGRYKLAS